MLEFVHAGIRFSDDSPSDKMRSGGPFVVSFRRRLSMAGEFGCVVLLGTEGMRWNRQLICKKANFESGTSEEWMGALQVDWLPGISRR